MIYIYLILNRTRNAVELYQFIFVLIYTIYQKNSLLYYLIYYIPNIVFKL